MLLVFAAIDSYFGTLGKAGTPTQKPQIIWIVNNYINTSKRTMMSWYRGLQWYQPAEKAFWSWLWSNMQSSRKYILDEAVASVVSSGDKSSWRYSLPPLIELTLHSGYSYSMCRHLKNLSGKGIKWIAFFLSSTFLSPFPVLH